MTRRDVLWLLSSAAACALPAGEGWALSPPSDRDLRIYAGLHAAAAAGNVEEIEKLIAAGERPNIQDASSRTPLHVAAYRRHHAAARALIRLGANPNALDAQRYDAVTIAVLQDDLDMLKLALEGGANPGNVTTPNDGSALIAAAQLGRVEVVRILIDAKARLDHANRLGWTALIAAVVLGNGGPDHVATVEALVKAGADTEIADRGGMTALAHARQRRYTDMIKILEPARGRRT